MKNILFNTEMTKAILDGRKVQTRRVIKSDEEFIKKLMVNLYNDYSFDNFIEREAKYQIGETIWVREPARVIEMFDKDNEKVEFSFQYLSDMSFGNMKVPSRFISKNVNEYKYPKWLELGQGIPNGCIKEMARIFLKITNVRVERLQDITLDDIIAEGWNKSTGFYNSDLDSALDWWETLWDKTAPKGYKWEDNPYVFVYEFERVNYEA
jgi:hypothetical protein